MAVEDHPKYSEWRMLLEDLINAIEAKKAGKASAADVEAARKALDEILDGFDE